MPFGAIPVIGAGAGAAAGMEGLQQNQLRQQDLLAQLMMHAQSIKAQREQTAAWREAQLEDKQQRTKIAEEGRQQQRSNAIPGGTVVGSDVVNNLGPSGVADFTAQQSLPSTQYSGWSQIQPSGQQTVGGQTGSASSGEVQAQQQKSLPTGMFTKNMSSEETARADAAAERKSRDAATEEQRKFNNWATMQRIGDSEGTAANRNAISQAQLELMRLRLEMERDRNEAAQARSPQPQFFQGDDNKWHAVVFQNGRFNEIPLPAGYVPTNKQAAPGWFSRQWNSLFGGGSKPAPSSYIDPSLVTPDK